MHGENRPYINVKTSTNQISALLDTGATKSTVNAFGKQFFLELGYRIIKVNSIESTMANGTKDKINKYFSVPIEFQDKMKLVKFFIFDNSPHKFILGSDFSNLFEIEMKCKNNKWQINTGEESISITNNIIDAQTLDKEAKRQLDRTIGQFKALCTGKIGKVNTYTHKINTGNADPTFERAYPASPVMQSRMAKELERMLSLDVIEKANSPWCSRPVLVKKKNGKDRLCIDLRKLNKVTVKSKYALPHIEQILSRLGKAKYISSIDLNDAFWQIPLDKHSRPKTAFNVPGKGMFQFKVVPFGLTTAAQAMQKVMDSLFSEFNEGGVFIYIDDLIIVSETFSEHIKSLQSVANQLKKANLTINFDKCEFCRSSLKYLGYIVDKHGLRTDPDKISCIANYQLPQTVRELRRFTGMASYYRRFIHKFAEIAAPLHELTKKSNVRRLKWNENAVKAFDALKNAMIQAPVLATPDFNREFSLQCDASDGAISSVLVQKDPVSNEEKPIAFASRKLRGAEIHYTTTEKECLAIVFGVEKFTQYIEGVKFEIITDHSALLWLLKQSNLKGRLARWVLKLQQFDFDIKHIKGKCNIVPDAISRFPMEEFALIEFNNTDVDPAYETLRSKIEKNPTKFSNYKVKDRKIYIKLNKQPGNNTEFLYKLLVPKTQIMHVMKECHDNPTAAHFGAFKTAKRIMQRYYWHGLVKDVKEYVRKCETCLKSKAPTKAQFGLMGKMKVSTRPWQVISMDLMGPFTRSSKGNQHLLVVCDHFTKMSVLIPLRDSKANKVCTAIRNEIFFEHGIPQTIISDNGKQFISKEFDKLIKDHNVKELFTNCVYHPQNNPTERTNKVIGSAMRSYIHDNHKHWDQHIKEIQVALRTATNVVTGYTPFYLDRGREFTISGSDYLLHEFDVEQINENMIENRANALNVLAKITSDVTKRMLKAYQMNKKYYDKNKVHGTFNIGDVVYRRNFVLSDAAKNFSAKLAPKYLKCTVIEKISELAYRLRDETGYEAVYHIKDIKNV